MYSSVIFLGYQDDLRWDGNHQSNPVNSELDLKLREQQILAQITDLRSRSVGDIFSGKKPDDLDLLFFLALCQSEL